MGGTFVYSNPRVINWGAGSLSSIGEEARRLGATRVVLVTTESVWGNTSSKSLILRALEPTPPEAVCFIHQHAPQADLERAIEVRLSVKADLVVSVGGGSPIDAAKVVARGSVNQNVAAAAVPHIAVPTTLSAAELGSRVGFTDESGDKAGFEDPGMLADAVFYDPDLAVFTPTWLWLSTGIRSLNHGVDGLLAEGEHPLSDVLALEAIRRLFHALPLVLADPLDVGARSECQVASWFSFTLPEPTAMGLGHRMSSKIGARHGIPHGITSCLLLPHVMRYLSDRNPGAMRRIGTALDSMLGGSVSAPDRIYDFIGALGLPQHSAEYGIGPAEFRKAAGQLAGAYPADDLFHVYMQSI